MEAVPSGVMHPMDFKFKKAIAENMDEMLAPVRGRRWMDNKFLIFTNCINNGALCQ
jgi:hypothetical protein